MSWGRSYPDTPARVTRVMMLLILAGVCVWAACGYAEASAQAKAQWNCPVSEWLYEVRDPGMPYWTPDWGVTWLEVER